MQAICSQWWLTAIFCIWTSSFQSAPKYLWCKLDRPMVVFQIVSLLHLLLFMGAEVIYACRGVVTLQDLGILLDIAGNRWYISSSLSTDGEKSTFRYCLVNVGFIQKKPVFCLSLPLWTVLKVLSSSHGPTINTCTSSWWSQYMKVDWNATPPSSLLRAREKKI